MISVVDDVAGLRALAAEWQALWGRAGGVPFQSPRWLLPWWDAFGTGMPLVAAWRDGGALRGVLPAYVLHEPDGPKLLPMGAGTTDYLDVLGDGAEPMLAALLDRAAADGVARCDWIELPPGSPLRGAVPPDGWSARLGEGSPCPVLPLSGPVPRFPGGIGRKLRMNRHRADRAGGWTVAHATPGTLDAGLDALVALHQARWTAGGEPGVLCDPAVLAFHRSAAPGLLDAGLLRLATLRVGGTLAAAILALLGPGRILFYLSGYDTAQAFVSPGTLLLGAMLEAAAAEGRTEAHFLRGREGYKYAWGAEDRMNATLHLRAGPQRACPSACAVA